MSAPSLLGSKLRAAGTPRALATLLLLAAGTADAQLSLPPDYAWRQLTPAGEAASEVSFHFAIDRRGEWVAFVGDVELAGAEAVYAVRRNGSALHRLSAYGALGSIQRLAISADGRRVIYHGDLETDGLPELWSAPLPGSPASAVKLNLEASGDGVLSVFLPEHGSLLTYYSETADGHHFWSVPAAGPASSSVRLDPTLEPDEILYSGLVATDGSRVALFLGDTVSGARRIWSVPMQGPVSSGLFVLETPPDSCTPVPVGTSAGSVFLAYTMSCETAGGSRLNQLWRVPFAGPAADAVSLAGSFVEGGEISLTAVSPDGEYLVVLADKLVDEKVELWSVPFAGAAGDFVRLNPALVGSGDVTALDISPDGTRIAYIADAISNETFRPWSVPIAGPATLAEPLVPGATAANADVTKVVFTPDSATVVFRGDLSADGRFDLYSVPADGSAGHERITNDSGIPGPDRSTGTLWKLHPDGRRVVFTVDEDSPTDQRGLYEQRLQPRYVQDARLNGDPVAGGRISSFEVFPDSAGTLYYSDELIDERYHLYAVDSRIFGDGFEEGTPAAWSDAP